MANFEVFRRVISSTINLLFLKSVLAKKVNALEEGPFVLPQRESFDCLLAAILLWRANDMFQICFDLLFSSLEQ